MAENTGAIETLWRGYRFRSRLEARWAVFFEAMRVPWEYEPQGYSRPFGPYLPDFLIASRLFVEIKPAGYRPAADESRRWVATAQQSDTPLVIARGVPLPDGSLPLVEPLDPMPPLPEFVRFGECRKCGALCYGSLHPSCVFHSMFCDPACTGDRWTTEGGRIAQAVVAARGARFEHGEAPVIPDEDEIARESPPRRARWPMLPGAEEKIAAVVGKTPEEIRAYLDTRDGR
jgi:hypothetical protein